MIAIDAAVEDDAGEPAPPAAAQFLGDPKAFWKLLVRGAVFLAVTLGIYRFWLVTDIRRFLWANTEIDGDTLEYIGTARELLLGFVVAIAILVTLYIAFFVAALDTGVIDRFAGLAALVALAVLGQFAVYRARRYRLTRTVFRGLRFHQTGSAWRYAISASLWWSVIVLTLGLAYPWAQANLERLKMRNTFYGDLRGGFAGSGAQLFMHGALLWLVVIGPLIVGLILPLVAMDWSGVIAAIQSGNGDPGAFEGANPRAAAAAVYLLIAPAWSIVAATLLYPVFQAIVLRWWLAGLRFGGIAVESRLRTGAIYGAYLRLLGYASVFSLAVAVVITVASFAIGSVDSGFGDAAAGEMTTGVLVICGYVAVALGYATIYQATVRLKVWQLAIASLDITGLSALERVKAVTPASSAVGEGLVDALNVGGY